MIEAIVMPFRALFVALFFVAMGTLLDPHLVLDHWLELVVIGVGFMLLRLGVWTGIGRLAGFPLSNALLMGAAMMPLGEFNIMLGNAATAAHRLSGNERGVLLGITFLSVLATTLSGPWLQRLHRRSRAPSERVVEGRVTGAPEVLIVGFGRVGRTVAEILARCEIPFAVLERDRALVTEARAQGIEAVVGDGGDPRALDAAVTGATRVIVATTPETTTNSAIAYRYAARPETLVIARAARPGDAAALRDRGAVQAFVPETEGALAFAAATLRDLDVPEERIDQEIATQRTEMKAAELPAADANPVAVRADSGGGTAAASAAARPASHDPSR
jgi:CPA2 family monovalent cation:H+ antiporter-2